MMRLPARRLAGIALAFAVFYALVGQPRAAMAKTPGYILTAGDLGEYAMHFYADDYLEHPNAEAVVVEAPDPATLDAPYLLYSTWPFNIARELATEEPKALLYEHKRLVFNTRSGEWLKISDKLWNGSASWSGVGRAIDEARKRLAAGKLEQGPVLAAFVGREFDRAVWDVWEGTGTSILLSPSEIPAESTRDYFYGGPDPRRGPSGDIAIRIKPGRFPLRALAESLTTPGRQEAPAVDVGDGTYVMYVHGPTSGGVIWSGPAFLYYSPPSARRAGVLWEATPHGQPMAWESTPEFDRLFAEALRQALLPTPAPAGADVRVSSAPPIGSRSQFSPVLLLASGAMVTLAVLGGALWVAFRKRL